MGNVRCTKCGIKTYIEERIFVSMPTPSNKESDIDAAVRHGEYGAPKTVTFTCNFCLNENSVVLK